MSYTMYTPLNVWLDPASVTDVVAYIQNYLSENTIYSEEEIEELIHDYLEAHPELIGGVQSVNGKTGTVVLSASDINTANNVTIESVLSSLSSQISSIAASVATNTSNITSLTGRVSTAETDLSNLKSNLYYGRTINLINPIHKEGTFDGITYTFFNGTIGLSGTYSGRVLMQTITGEVGDKYSLSCNGVNGEKPTFYIMNGGTVVSTYRQVDVTNTFTLPVETVTLEFYVSGTFNYNFALTLVKDEVPSIPLNWFDNGQNTIVNFSNISYEAIGDSLTYGFTGSFVDGVQQRIAIPYPEKVKEILSMQTAINKGETGTTIANDLDKMETYYPISNDNRLNGYSFANVISVMGGLNDFLKGTALGSVFDNTTLATFHAGWKRILANLVNRFSQYYSFVFVIIPPLTTGIYDDNSAGVKFIDYVNATLEECRIYGVPVLDMSTLGRLTMANRNIYTSDGYHFNQLYVSKIFAPAVADFIKRNIH